MQKRALKAKKRTKIRNINSKISTLTNPKTQIMFTYSTGHFEKKDKIRFYYALKGRDGKSGIARKLKLQHLAPTVFIVKQKHEKDLQEFLDYWKISYQKYNISMEKIE